ncbi:MerR family transcriptional regulator [Pectinatus frisingensis]|uniref:MerR family transcriptional regulator n=1 Tax=Pectinatus frisingensis TaxID=865 RepID=UPI0018C7F735|nr:MerR family transcriptional regulator [Pectinatus frisingensis]
MTIGELSKVTNISEYTLRYYEKKELIRVSRDKADRRCYSKDDIDWVLFIKRLKDTGMLLRDIEKYAKLRYDGDSTMPRRLLMLQAHRNYILEEQRKWAEYLANLDNKITFYKDKINEKKLAE